MKSSIGEIEKCMFTEHNKWMAYVNSLSIPNDEIDRSINQYKCEVFMRKLLHENCVIRELAAIPLVLIALFGTYIRSKINKIEKSDDYCDMLVLVEHNKQSVLTKEKIPKELLDKYHQIVFLSIKRKSMLLTGRFDDTAGKIIKMMFKRRPSSPYLLFVAAAHLSAICEWINRYHPKCIVVSEGENDYTSSIIKLYCETNNIKYINIMHGENFINPYHAFVEFSEFFVWHDYYIEQYLKTGSPLKMFRTYKPEIMENHGCLKEEPEFYLTYYLQGQTTEEMRKIRTELEYFISKGEKCKIRPHRLATDILAAKEIFAGSKIVLEDPDSVGIDDSMANSLYIVSMYSTVITQAYAKGMVPIIDDITNPELYRGLIDCMYINISRVTGRLSNLIFEG